MSQLKFDRILKKELVPLDINELTAFKVYCSSLSLRLQQWIDISLTLFKIDKELCNQFLVYVEKHEIGRTSFKDFIHQNAKITIYNNLAGLNLGKAVRESTKEEMQKSMNDARKFLNASQKVKMTTEKTIIMTRGFLHYYSGEIVKAANIFNKTYEEATSPLQDPQTKHLAVTSALGLAATHFIRKNYQKALELYKKCLQTHKRLPVKARLGMAYCFYYLNKYQLAEFAFQRILKLQPQCLQALIGLAVIADKKQLSQQYFQYLIKAYHINSKHPLVLLHLAEHYLFRSDQQKTILMCTEGLKSIQSLPKFLKCQPKVKNDYEQYKARFNNILGQLWHINGDYQKCLKYYLNAHERGIDYNSINLCQAYMHPNYLNYIEALKCLEDLIQNTASRQSKLLGEIQKICGYLKSKIPGRKSQDPTMLYKEAIRYNKNDYQVYIQYANLIMETKKAKTLQLLISAKNILQKLDKPIKLQLLNNIAVFKMETGEYEESFKLLNTCLIQGQYLQNNSNNNNNNNEENLKQISLILIFKINLALVYTKLNLDSKAIILLDQIIAANKYYLDSYIHKAWILNKNGMIDAAIKQLDKGIEICEASHSKILRQDRILNMKAHLLHMNGSDSKSKEIIKVLAKNKDVYSQFYQICIDYESIMRKQTQLTVLKDFLRPKRQFCVKYCQTDPNGIFGYMLLIVLLLTDKKITKNQAMEFFTQIRDGEFQLPSILYNMGLYLFNFEDYQNAIIILGRYKQRTGRRSVDQLISLVNLVNGKYDQSIKIIKRNILHQPRNMKYRYQLAYVNEKKSESVFNEKERTMGQMKLCYEMLKNCSLVYYSLSRINISDYLKGHENIEMKEKMRIIFGKIKQACEQRKHYVKSKMQYYQKTQKQVQRREREQEESRKITLERLKQAKLKDSSLLVQLMDDEEDDEEKLHKQIQEEKKRRLLAKMKEREEEMNKAFQETQERVRANQDEKKARRNTKKTKKRQVVKERQSSDKDSFLSEEKVKEQQPSGKRSKRYESDGKDNRKLKKVKLSSEQSEIKEESERPKSVKDQEEEDDLKKYLIEE